MNKITEFKYRPNEIEERILENQEIMLLALCNLVQKSFNKESGDTKIINGLIDCYHATRKINNKSFINRGMGGLLDKDYYEEDEDNDEP